MWRSGQGALQVEEQLHGGPEGRKSLAHPKGVEEASVAGSWGRGRPGCVGPGRVDPGLHFLSRPVSLDLRTVGSLALCCPEFPLLTCPAEQPASRLLFPSFLSDSIYGAGRRLHRAFRLRRRLFYLLTHSPDTRLNVFHVRNMFLPICFTWVLLRVSARSSSAPAGISCPSPPWSDRLAVWQKVEDKAHV